jgi:hypothetical protein
MFISVMYDNHVCSKKALAILRVEVMSVKSKSSDPGTRLAQEIIEFAKKNNMKIRKKGIQQTEHSKNLQKRSTS